MSADGLTELRRLHERLGRTVRVAETVFARIELPETRSPERAELAVVFEQTKELASGLAAFLDGLDRELGNEGSSDLDRGGRRATQRARLAPDAARTFLLDAEPPPAADVGAVFDPRVPRRSSVIGKLPTFYAFHVGLNNRLYDKHIPRSYLWKESVALWVTITYFGGTHAVGGLLSRLDHISDLPGVRTEPRSVMDSTTLEGDVLVLGAEAPTQSYPWDRRDIDELVRVSERAKLLANATDEAIAEEARAEWCRNVDNWLAPAARIEFAGSIVAGLIDEAPAPSPTVRERLEKLAAHPNLAEDARAKARGRLTL